MLSWLAPDGFPVSARLPIRVDAGARAIQFTAEPAGLPLLEGRACLAVHRHAPDFTWQSNFQVRGNLAKQGDGWRLQPRRLIGGFEVPDSTFGRYSQFLTRMIPYHRTARRRIKETKA